MIDLEPATSSLAALVVNVRDDQLDRPTPCPGTSVAAMLDHIHGLSIAFANAATKSFPEGGSQPPSADAGRLAADWRTRIPDQLAALSQAWRAEDAWVGMSEAGGVALPAEAAGVIGLNEVIVHGWDLARSTGQPYRSDAAALEAAYGFVQSAVAEHPNGSPGLFGPPVPVADDAPLLDRLIGLTGRDPRWSPGESTEKSSD